MTTFSGLQHGHDPPGRLVQVLAQAVLEQGHVDHALALGHADCLGKVADGLGRVAAAAQAGDGRQARVVPAAHEGLVHQLQQLALAHHGVVQVQAGELDLLRVAGDGQVVQHPVVERAMVLELQRADGMGDPLQRVGDGVGVVVHRVDAPAVAGAVVAFAADAVEHRVAHVHVGRGHVDLGAQHVGAVGELPGAHALEQVQVLRDRALAVGAVVAAFGQRAAVLPHLLGRQVADIGLAGADQVQGEFVQLLEIIRGVIEALGPVETQPAHVVLDGVDVFHVLLARVGVVEAQVAQPLVLGGQAEVEADGLGVADVQVAVGLGRKARVHAAAVLAGPDVGLDDGADEIQSRGRIVSAHVDLAGIS